MGSTSSWWLEDGSAQSTEAIIGSCMIARECKLFIQACGGLLVDHVVIAEMLRSMDSESGTDGQRCHAQCVGRIMPKYLLRCLMGDLAGYRAVYGPSMT